MLENDQKLNQDDAVRAGMESRPVVQPVSGQPKASQRVDELRLLDALSRMKPMVEDLKFDEGFYSAKVHGRVIREPIDLDGKRENNLGRFAKNVVNAVVEPLLAESDAHARGA